MASSTRSSQDHQTESAGLEEPQTSTHHSLSQALYARRADYTRPHHIRIKVGTWNVAASPGTEKDVGAWFVDGKGIDVNLTGLTLSNQIKEKGSQDHIESVEQQEARRSKKQSTVPKNDKGAIAGGDEIGLYVLGLQEVVELTSAAQYISRVYTDPGPLAKWRKAMLEALPKGYELISEQQLSGLVLMIFASPEIAPSITSVSSVCTGTGVMGYLGNKGGIATRIFLGETTKLVFVNSHLASGTDATHLDRRCWDVAQILSKTKFDPISRGGVLDDIQDGIGDEDFAFWFGDLNFRLEGLPGHDIRRLLMLHTRGEYGKGAATATKLDDEMSSDRSPIVIRPADSDDDSPPGTPQTKDSSKDSDDTDGSSLPDPDEFVQDPSADPLSLQATLDSLLPHDQLRRVRKEKKAFHDGWREGPVTFLPTYRYDVGTMGLFDSSEKKRTPSWCDRILFRTRKDKVEFDGKTQEEEISKLRDKELKARGIDRASDEEDILFEYDPEADGAEDDDNPDYDEHGNDESAPPIVLTKEGYLETIKLDVYTSHQRVLSSDHKPVDAVFTLRYDAVVPELKTKVQHEVARELDRAENEGRPNITVVVDHAQEDDSTNTVARNESESVDGVDFGDVRFLARKRRGVTVANTGQISATFRFVSHSTSPEETQSIAPEWLAVALIGSEHDDERPSRPKIDTQIVLDPGDAINVALEIFISSIEQVRAFNKTSAKIDDVLVLRVTDGRDHFIPVRGTWLQSCFGGTIDELIRVPEGGVRALVPRRDGKGEGLVNRGEDVRWSAPREILKLTEAVESLTDRAIAERDMIDELVLPTDQPGWPFDASTWIINDPSLREARQSSLLEALDSDANLITSFEPEVPAHEKLEVTAEVLLMLLSSLSDGIVTAELWGELESGIDARQKGTAMSSEEEKAWALDVMASAPNHNISLVFLTSMLGKVASSIAPVASRPTQNPTSPLISVRRSISFKGRSRQEEDKSVLQRRRIDRRYAEIFTPAIFRSATSKDRDKKAAYEKQKRLLEVFLDDV